MSFNYTLKYRRFDQVLDDIQVDFKSYSLESMIEPQELIKVVKRVNYDLGLRINTTQETLLEVCKGNVKLPDDFFVLNYALCCDEVTVHQGIPQGTWIEERPFVTPYQATPVYIDPCCPPVVNCNKCNPNPCNCNCTEEVPPCQLPIINSCTKPRIELNCKGEPFELVQIVNPGLVRTYRRTSPIKILANPQMVDCGCPNLYINCEHSAWIRNGFLYTTLRDAVIYVSYQGQLQDEEGNLLLPDHDMLNEYYEYAIKERILENLMMNDEPIGQKLELVRLKLRESRNNALSIVNMPNFAEMKAVFDMNRKAQYSKYYAMFSSYGNGAPGTLSNAFINGYNK